MNKKLLLDRLETLAHMIQNDLSMDAYWSVQVLMKEIAENEKISNIYESAKPILCVDFDGVIHSYKSGWKGVASIPDPPNTGAIEWITSTLESFDVRIFSARCNDPGGIEAMIGWFREWGLPDEAAKQLRYEPGKPSAFLVIDDRAVQFAGDFSQLRADQLRAFKPWYYGHEGWNR